MTDEICRDGDGKGLELQTDNLEELDLSQIIDDINQRYGGRAVDGSNSKADARRYALLKIRTEGELPEAGVWKTAVEEFDQGNEEPLVYALRRDAFSLIRDNMTFSRRLGWSLTGLLIVLPNSTSQIDFSGIQNGSI